ncbi:MAG TPA: YcaO-like family protein, partial [Polyangiaceae bacterium]
AEGWSLSVLDLTHDLGPYVFAAVAAGPSPRQLAIGLGCHLDGRLAIQRALAELNQLRGPGEQGNTRLDLDALPSRAYLAPDPSERLAGPECFPGLGKADLGADVTSCVDRLARRGLDVIVVDKTRPDLGIPVAQVLVPGLRHFWPRFGPGRLFTVPVELGWSSAAASEDDLNPVAFLL